MLQTFLVVAIPTLITLTAAFYILRRLAREDERGEQYSQWSFSTQRSNRRTPSPHGDSVVNRRNRNVPRNIPNSHYGECVVCFEETLFVQLYPCRHTSLCEQCVTKLITDDMRVCPLCRTQIQGYSEVF